MITEANRPYEPFGAAKDLWTNRGPEILLSGPAGCVAGETRLYDPIAGQHVPIADLVRDGIAPVVQTLWGPARATVPFLKGVARLYRVRMESGREVVVTSDHKMLTPNGWTFLGSLVPGDRLLSRPTCLPPTSSASCLPESLRDELRSIRRDEGCRGDCSRCHRQGDGQPLREAEGDRASLPSQGDARERSRDGWLPGAQDDARGYSRACPPCVRPSTPDCSLPTDETACVRSGASQGTTSPASCWSRLGGRSPRETSLPWPDGEPGPRCDNTPRSSLRFAEAPLGGPYGEQRGSRCRVVRRSQWLAWGRREVEESASVALASSAYSLSSIPPKSNYRDQWDRIYSITYERTDEYFDLHVPGAEHYLAEGIWHHNTGKSRACLEKVHAVCLRWPNARCLMVRKTRESLTETALVTFEEKVLPANSPIAEGSRRSHRQAYHYPNGSTVVVGGLDKPGKVMSTEYDLIYIQEAIECYENDWESLTTRLRNGVVPFQQLIADTNPDRPTHWLKQRVDRGATVMLESRHEDNPRLWDRKTGQLTTEGQAYIPRLDALTGARKPRLRHGKWVQSEGVVYDEWDRQVHVIDPFEIPASWRRIRAIDFGYSNPFVCLWIAIDDDCRMYVYRELYMTKRTVKVHAAQINALSEGETFEFSVSDHDAEDRATLLENGIATVPARKDVSPGIEAVQERLKSDGSGRKPSDRRLYVFRNCLVERDKELEEAKRPCSILEEFDSYSWPKADDGKAVKEAPEKINDHAMDAVRYAAMSIDRGVMALEPAHIVEERERKAKEDAERAHFDVNNSMWWEGHGGFE